MKVLVLGASGMVGHVIAIYLQERGFKVTTFTRSPFKYCQNIIGDATDHHKLSGIIKEKRYDAIINSIGILNEEADYNKPLAILLNSYLPHFLSQLAQSKASKVIQISTDCVFSGKEGSYTEKSLPDGLAFYDKTKALGEIVNKRDLTFRTSIIGPDLNKEGAGLFNWFMSQVSDINGYSSAIWTGVTSLVLAEAIESALAQNLTGLYHLVNNVSISKLELLNMFNHYMRCDRLNIKPSDIVMIDKSLINTRKDFIFTIPEYAIMVAEMKEWIKGHRELYPHYFE